MSYKNNKLPAKAKFKEVLKTGAFQMMAIINLNNLTLFSFIIIHTHITTTFRKTSIQLRFILPIMWVNKVIFMATVMTILFLVIRVRLQFMAIRPAMMLMVFNAMPFNTIFKARII
ncbi:hypothetical protein HanRHA438_Chr08g0334591 [Helianthus annuus]|nr:hypothetical protein HanRHA438_Chr08g0334591 [Helianthus annuus]